MSENAARVAWAGVGVSVPRRMTTPRGIRLAVRKLLSEPKYSAKAAELRDWATRHDGAKNAADAVETLSLG
jgi:UDP:flavonoid glycosyltransferase YjiC (YdhE family)